MTLQSMLHFFLTSYSADTLRIAEKYVSAVRNTSHKHELVIVLVGNKLDLDQERKITKKQATDFIRRLRVLYILKLQTKKLKW
jgi:GTPase SAR1 family protein